MRDQPARLACRWARGIATIAHQRYIMSILIGALVTFLVVILVLYLVNMLPVDGRTKQIVRVIVIIIGVLSLIQYLGAWV